MKLKEFLDKYLGQSKGYPDDSLYKGQCLSIVKLYIKECFGISPPPSGSGSAYGYWSNFPNPLGEVFEKVDNTPDLIPEVGWIAIWKPWSSNQYGHIAIVADGCTTGTLKNWAQNWTSRTFQLESNRYTNVIGFLKPKDNMTDEQKRALDALQQAVDKGLYGNIESAARAIVDLKKDVEEYKKHIESLDKKIVHLEAKTETLSESITTKDEEFRLATAEIGKKNLQITELEKLLSYEQSNTSTANDLDIKELFTLLIKKLWPQKK